MGKELEDKKRGILRKIVDILNIKGNKTILVRMFDALVSDSSCGHSGCGCDKSFSSSNITGLQMLSSGLEEKYGWNKFKFEVFNVSDPRIKEFDGVYNLLKERRGGALPIISINGKIKFIGRIPSLEEVEGEIKAIM